jgi:hypothetical protein
MHIARIIAVKFHYNRIKNGNHECSKDIFLSDCKETSQERYLGSVEVHSGFEKMYIEHS